MIKLFLILYVIPLVLCLLHTKVLYSNQGRLGNLKADTTDYLFCLVPLFNLGLSIVLWAFNWPLKKEVRYEK